jgi:hypothetical protein
MCNVPIYFPLFLLSSSRRFLVKSSSISSASQLSCHCCVSSETSSPAAQCAGSNSSNSSSSSMASTTVGGGVGVFPVDAIVMLLLFNESIYVYICCNLGDVVMAYSQRNATMMRNSEVVLPSPMFSMLFSCTRNLFVLRFRVRILRAPCPSKSSEADRKVWRLFVCTITGGSHVSCLISATTFQSRPHSKKLSSSHPVPRLRPAVFIRAGLTDDSEHATVCHTLQRKRSTHETMTKASGAQHPRSRSSARVRVIFSQSEPE